jgi:dephospho-CoA kinase
MSAAKVIAVVGLSGTGKSLAAAYLKKKYHLTTIYFGGYVIEEVRKRNLEVTSNNERIVREDLRINDGMDAIAKLAIDAITAATAQNHDLLIDGLYSFSEYLYLKKIYGPNLILIANHSERLIRYERLKNRPVRPLQPEEVDQRDLLEIQMIEKGGPIAIADYHVMNNNSEEELYAQLDRIAQYKIHLKAD